MKNIYIIGAGGFGHELFEYLSDVIEKGLVEGEFKGFLDDTFPTGSQTKHGHSVIDTINNKQPAETDLYLVGIGDPKERHRIFASFKEKGAKFMSLIHPSAYVASSAKIGEGVILCPFSFVGANASIGRNSVLNIYSSVGHDCVVQESVVLSPYASLNGHVKLSDEVFLGSGAVVTKGFNVGGRARIAAGSVLYNDLAANAEAFGNPARSKK